MANALVNSQVRIPPLGRQILVLTGCTLSILAALVASMTGVSPGWSASFLAAFPAVLLLSYGLRKAFQVAQRVDLFSPVAAFPVAYALWFMSGTPILPEGATRIAVYSTTGLLCYLLGVASMRRKANWTWLTPEGCLDEWDRTAFFRVVVCLSVLACGSYLSIVTRMGVPALSPDAGELRLRLVNYGPEIQVFFTSSYTVLLFLSVFLWKNRESRTVRFVCYSWLGALSMALLSLGARGFLTVPLVTALIARHYTRNPYRIAALFALGAVLFVSLSLYGYTRDTLLSQGTLDIAGDDTIVGRLFPFIYVYLYVVQPVDTLEQVTEIIPRKVGYQHGELTFGALKTVLPGHHEMSDMFFKKILGSDFLGGGQPATLLGPFYGDFGLPGIAVGTFALGLLLTQLYSWMKARPTLFRVLIYAWSMQTALFSLFGAIFPYITTLWLPVFWFLLHTGVLRRSRDWQSPSRYPHGTQFLKPRMS
jgi:oligosaccharide repeat unit polymerase